MLFRIQTKNALGWQDAVDNGTSVRKQNKRKKKKKKLAENPRINMLTYRHLLIKYHCATGVAEFGPVAAESFDNKEAPMNVRIHSNSLSPCSSGLKFLVCTTLPCEKLNNGET